MAPELRLSGCRSRPLIGYLKSLGVLRTVSRQRDPRVRGRWRSGVFELRCDLSEKQLAAFFANDYQPTPILSPWNGRSGFYPKGNTAAAKWLSAVESSNHARLEPYRELIAATRSILADLGITEKPENEAKTQLLLTLRKRWPDTALEWLDAAVVQAGGAPRFPKLLGSGGNDGSYDFSSNFLEAVAGLDSEPPAKSEALLATALFDRPGQLERTNSAYLQRDSSPTNSPGGDASSLGNPWDLILALEGSMTFVGSAARLLAEGDGRMTAPFAVRATGAGYGSAVAGEDGDDELWLPLWSDWTTYPAIEHLAREARAQVRGGRTVRWARSGLELARAAGDLGVARGISAFERYVILNRAGQARLAVPAGRIVVRSAPPAEALRTLDSSLGRLLRLVAAENCPRAVERAVRRLEGAVFTLATRGRTLDGLRVLEALAGAEAAVASSSSAHSLSKRPVTGVAARPWLDLCADGSPEFAVAASLGSLRDRYSDRRSPALRDYLHGTAKWGTEYDHERRHRVSGSSSGALLANLHARRHLDAARSGSSGVGLNFDLGTWAGLETAQAFSAGGLDDVRILALTRAICLLDHDRAPWKPRSVTTRLVTPNPPFDLLALAWRRTTEPQDGEPQDVGGPRPGWVARLASGRPEAVLRGALLDLRQARLVPVLMAADLIAGVPDGPRLASALLLPLGARDIEALKRRLLAGSSDPNEKELTA